MGFGGHGITGYVTIEYVFRIARGFCAPEAKDYELLQNGSVSDG
jgi:hypothetical protein